MVILEDYFPQGIATGSSFIGREKEIKELRYNIQAGHHTLLLAPRRFGKTSLALNALEKLKIPYVETNFYLTISTKAIEKKILTATESLIRDIAGKPEAVLASIQSFFKASKKKWSISFKGIIGLELTPDNYDNYPENIITALKLAEHVLCKYEKKAVIFIDEVQELKDMEGGREVQAAIREFAQRSKWITFIFSGSNRRMLMQIFDDKNMPLYELCERIILDKIDINAYQKYLKTTYKKVFNNELSNDAFMAIIELTHRHPKRVNNLCYQLWRFCLEHKKEPDDKTVRLIWDRYLQQRQKDVQYRLHKLSIGQLKVLTLIACDFDGPLSGRPAQHKVDMASSSISKALQLLEENDYIEKNNLGVYKIIDPLIKGLLLKYELDNLN